MKFADRAVLTKVFRNVLLRSNIVIKVFLKPTNLCDYELNSFIFVSSIFTTPLIFRAKKKDLGAKIKFMPEAPYAT